ncbi:hypothetical protein Mal4_28560 [Maioricimonas rarisocia]|uniref:Uncharacterized protein n=1 Tax=Maioricimonas rarisocia TaxID=2528026 RepID=A0A517Z7R8_9PLAN|nr:hypothetical protein [Maioricimonas rarisocia]QDU38527.1 hypothetical protein Mal4_28560 [Maioricimonas rarisocia]
MSVSVTCPGCAKRYKVPDSKIGNAIACKHCDTQIFVSASGDESKRLRTRREAATEMSEMDAHLRKSGIALMLVGLASFVLPMMGMQLRMFARLGDSAQVGGAIAAYVGVALFIYAMRREPLAAAIGGGSVAAIVTVLAAPYLQQQNGAPAVAQQPPPQAVPGAAPQAAPPAARSGQPQQAHQPEQPQQRGGPPPGFGSRPRPPFNRPEGFGPRNRGPGAGRPTGRPSGQGAARTQGSRTASSTGTRQTQLDLSSQTEGNPVNLLDVIQPSRDKLIGPWTLQNGTLTSPMLQPARIDVPVKPPSSYVLTVEAERLQGRDSLNLGLVVGGRGVTVIMDGYGGQVTGLNRLDGRTGDVNESTHRGKVLPNGRRNTIVCTVTPKSVLVSANGRTVINWTGSPQRLSRDHRWTPGLDDHLQIGCWATKWRITRMELTPTP